MSATPSSARTRDLTPSEPAPRVRRSSMPVAYDIEESAFFDTANIVPGDVDDLPLEQTAEFQARLQNAVRTAAHRNRFQVRVLYSLTAAACFTAIALGFELQRQKHQTAELTTQALALSRAPERNLTERALPAAAALAAPVAEPAAAPQPLAVAAPEAEFLAMEAEAEKAKAPEASPATVQAAPNGITEAASAPDALKAQANVPAPKPVVANAAPRINTPAVTPKPTLAAAPRPLATPQPRTLAASTPASDPEISGAPANLTREVRPGTASAKPPTRSFPAVNR